MIAKDRKKKVKTDEASKLIKSFESTYTRLWSTGRDKARAPR